MATVSRLIGPFLDHATRRIEGTGIKVELQAVLDLEGGGSLFPEGGGPRLDSPRERPGRIGELGPAPGGFQFGGLGLDAFGKLLQLLLV